MVHYFIVFCSSFSGAKRWPWLKARHPRQPGTSEGVCTWWVRKVLRFHCDWRCSDSYRQPPVARYEYQRGSSLLFRFCFNSKQIVSCLRSYQPVGESNPSGPPQQARLHFIYGDCFPNAVSPTSSFSAESIDNFIEEESVELEPEAFEDTLEDHDHSPEDPLRHLRQNVSRDTYRSPLLERRGRKWNRNNENIPTTYGWSNIEEHNWGDGSHVTLGFQYTRKDWNRVLRSFATDVQALSLSSRVAETISLRQTQK